MFTCFVLGSRTLKRKKKSIAIPCWRRYGEPHPPQKWIQSSGPAICSVRVLFFNALHKLSSLNIYIFFIFFFFSFLSFFIINEKSWWQRKWHQGRTNCLQPPVEIENREMQKEKKGPAKQDRTMMSTQKKLYFVACK